MKMEFQKLVKRLCKNKKVSVFQLEQELNFSNAYIAKADKSKFVMGERVAQICDYCDVEIKDFVEICEPMSVKELVTMDEFYLLSSYRKLDKTNQETLINVLNNMK